MLKILHTDSIEHWIKQATKLLLFFFLHLSFFLLRQSAQNKSSRRWVFFHMKSPWCRAPQTRREGGHRAPRLSHTQYPMAAPGPP